MRIKHLSLILLLSVFITVLTAVELPVQTVIPVSVSVTGDVSRPGVYTLTTMNRVSEALARADYTPAALPASDQLMPGTIPQGITGFRLPATTDTTKAVVLGNRNITLLRQGQQQSLDLLRFMRLGELSQNPYLKDGDVIIVNPVQSVISLQGSVRKAGDYEFKQGDTLKDLLDLALGVTEEADLRHVKLYRYKENFIDYELLEINAAGYPQTVNAALDMLLAPGDR
ncbi:MAG: SLBB domain-containing protein, partial [Candidatus Cloacimonadaceae bacterium]